MEPDGIKGTRMTLHKGLYDRLIYEDEVGEVASLTGQHRALVTMPTAHQRREQFIAELVHRLPELLDAAAANQPDASDKAKAEIELIRPAKHILLKITFVSFGPFEREKCLLIERLLNKCKISLKFC